MKTYPGTLAVLCAAGLGLCTNPEARAAEGFHLRYNTAGSLGGELFSSPKVSGLLVGIAVTYADVKKVTGSDGEAIAIERPAGTLALAGVPAAFHPTYAASRAVADATGTLTLYNLGLLYITPEEYRGGRMVYSLNLPYGMKKQTFKPIATTPALSYPDPAVPNPLLRPTIAQAFDTGYQGALASRAAAEGGEVSGIGDMEVSAGWLFSNSQWRVLTGVALAMPTGRHNPNPGADAGAGNFYTVRPSIQVNWLPRPDISLAGKVSLGLNTTNRDNRLHSGNWVGLEGAVGYMTPLGPVGVHMVHVQQYQDDRGNIEFGASRYRSSHAGVFWTTRVPFLNAVMTVQYMGTLSSRNAKDTTITQLRLLKAF